MMVLLMGVTGSGKTTIGELLARRMGAVFADADDFHTAANKAKMAAGVPLTDADRGPWLVSLNELLVGWLADKREGVLACSALKESYRAVLTAGMPRGGVRGGRLDGTEEMSAGRLAGRRHAYMNPKLLESQLATLERPGGALRIVNDRSPEVVVDEILTEMQA